MSDWYEVIVAFPAESQEEAERIWEGIGQAACEGTGEGEDHVCKRDIVSSIRPAPKDEEE